MEGFRFGELRFRGFLERMFEMRFTGFLDGSKNLWEVRIDSRGSITINRLGRHAGTDDVNFGNS